MTAVTPSDFALSSLWLKSTDHTNQLIKRAILVFGWAILSVAAGHQWFGDSPDLANYLYYYNTIGDFFNFSDSRFEYGFQAVCWLWVQAGLSFYSLYVILVGVSLGFKFFLFEKYTASPILAAITYVLAFYLLHEYTQIRAAVGISLSLFAVHQMLNRKWLSFAIFCILGILFHYSVIAIPLTALISLRIRGRAVVAVAAIVLIAGSTMLPVVQEIIISIFSKLNPLTTAYVYNDLNINSANIFSVASVLTLGVIVWCIISPDTLKADYTRVFFGMALASYMSLVMLRESLELALRLRDALEVGIIFLVFREQISPIRIPPILMWSGASMYLFYVNVTSEVLK